MEFHIPIQLIPGAISLLPLLLFLYCLAQWKRKTNTIEKQPPLPSNSWPIIGHLHLLKGLPHIALGKLADEYGPIFMFKLGVRQALVVSTAEIAKECLGGINDKVFLNRPQTSFEEHTTYDSAMFGFSPYGQYWREMRKIVTVELLSNHRVEMFKDVRISEVRSAITEISTAEPQVCWDPYRLSLFSTPIQQVSQNYSREWLWKTAHICSI